MQIYWNIKKAGRKVRPECEIIATIYNNHPMYYFTDSLSAK